MKLEVYKKATYSVEVDFDELNAIYASLKWALITFHPWVDDWEEYLISVKTELSLFEDVCKILDIKFENKMRYIRKEREEKLLQYN